MNCNVKQPSELPPAKSGTKPKPILLKRPKGKPAKYNPPLCFLVLQSRLARIKALESNVAFERYQIDEEYKAIRRDMKAGAEVQKGPLRAWLEYSLRFVGKRKTKGRVKLVIR